MSSCWALSNINSEEISSDTQASIESGELLPALSFVLEEEIYNEDVLEKVLWLLTNITRTDTPENKLAAAKEDLEILGHLACLLEFDEERSTSNKIPIDALEFGDKIVAEASKPLLNLFFEGIGCIFLPSLTLTPLGDNNNLLTRMNHYQNPYKTNSSRSMIHYIMWCLYWRARVQLSKQLCSISC